MWNKVAVQLTREIIEDLASKNNANNQGTMELKAQIEISAHDVFMMAVDVKRKKNVNASPSFEWRWNICDAA